MMPEPSEKITINPEDLEKATPEPIRIDPNELKPVEPSQPASADFAVIADLSESQPTVAQASGEQVVVARFADETNEHSDERWKDIKDIPEAIPVEHVRPKTNRFDTSVVLKIAVTLIPFVNAWVWWRHAPPESPQQELYRSAAIFLFGMSIVVSVAFGLVIFWR